MTKQLALAAALAFAAALSACGGDCPHVCYCCQSVSLFEGEASCAESSYLVLMPSSSLGPICYSCKSGCEDKAPGTTAVACRDYGPSGENAGCTIDD